MTAILTHVRTVVVPVVNADGYVYTRSFPVETGTPYTGDGYEDVVAGGQGAYVRKNRRPLLSSSLGAGLLAEVPKPVKEDAIGVDPNRNYSYSWGDDQGGSSADELAQTYRGTDPLSEQESRNVAAIIKGRNVLAMVTNHTSGDLVLWAWGDTTADAPDNALLEGFGRAMATYNGYVPQKSIQLYATTGTTSDYAYGVTGSIGYTFEHAGVAFHPPYADTVPAMYQRNREAFILLATLACLAPEQRPKDRFTAAAKAQLAKQKWDGRLTHAIVTGKAVDAKGKKVAATLTVTKSFDTVLWHTGAGNPLGQKVYPEQITMTTSTPADGHIEWHLNPSTRPIVAAAGGREAYLLTVTGPTGVGVSRRVVLKRGQRLDLGTVVVG